MLISNDTANQMRDWLCRIEKSKLNKRRLAYNTKAQKVYWSVKNALSNNSLIVLEGDLSR